MMLVRFLLLSLAFPILLALASCEKHSSPPADTGLRPDTLNGATISGTVSLSGPEPTDACVSPVADGACHCTSVTAEHWVTQGGKVANAFVYIKDGLGNTVWATPAQPVVLDQKGCVYRPHVMGVMVGQTLKVLNSDSTLHNVHLVSASAGESFNKLFPQAMAPMEQKMTVPGVMKTIKCDVHSWMNSYVGVLPHPFFAVSDTNGHFEIRGVPPGEYAIELWHESSKGAEDAIIETKKVKLVARQSVTADFAIAAR